MLSVVSPALHNLGISDAAEDKMRAQSHYKAAENAPAEISPREAWPARRGRTEHAAVCLLDDHPFVLKATTRLLNAGGWKVECFADPKAFLRYAETQHPAVAVIDIWMPGMNGFEVQLNLKTLSPATRVIVLTSKDSPEIRARALHAGASAFFIKGMAVEQLLGAIRSVVSNQDQLASKMVTA